MHTGPMHPSARRIVNSTLTRKASLPEFLLMFCYGRKVAESNNTPL